jgi:glycosyltransferase involved in cell wall biosynthesis
MRLFISAGVFYPTTLGGPSKSLFWLAKELIVNDIEVSVVTTNFCIEDKTIETDRWINYEGMRIRYCKTSIRFSLLVLYHGLKEIRNCDVVLLSSISYFPLFFLSLYSTLLGKKVIWSPRGEMMPNALNNNRIKPLYFKLIRILMGTKVSFHATSLAEKESILRFMGLKSKTHVIPNFMALPAIQKRKLTENYFLYVGRIAPIKAIDRLFNGLLLSEDFLHSDYKLYIVGENEKQFQNYNATLNVILDSHPNLKSRVVFLGHVDGDEKFKLYANAYFTFLISHSENFGNVVIESLSQGTPVIASKGTPWKTLEIKNAGLHIDNSEDNIADTIKNVLSLNIVEYNDMRKNALEFSKEFDIKQNINEWLTVLK